VIKARRVGWAGHVTRTEGKNTYKILFGKTEGKDHLEDLSVDDRKIVNFM
jgi:hypothetical protein